jgi:hypothetical protein
MVPDLVAELLKARHNRKAAEVRAVDVHQAIAVARALQDQTGPHWFRGQVRNYPVLSSSFHRLPEADHPGAMQRLYRFSRWVESTRGLERLAVATCKHPRAGSQTSAGRAHADCN